MVRSPCLERLALSLMSWVDVHERFECSAPLQASFGILRALEGFDFAAGNSGRSKDTVCPEVSRKFQNPPKSMCLKYDYDSIQVVPPPLPSRQTGWAPPTFRSLFLACSMSCTEQRWTSCRRCCRLWCSVCSSSSCILRCSLSWLNWCCSCCSDDCDWDSCISRLCFNREIWRGTDAHTEGQTWRESLTGPGEQAAGCTHLSVRHSFHLLKGERMDFAGSARRVSRFKASLGSSMFVQQNITAIDQAWTKIGMFKCLKPPARNISYF